MLNEFEIGLEVESFNLADLDVSGLDIRLELTAIVPEIIVCGGNCPENCTVHGTCSAFCTDNTCKSFHGSCNVHS